MQAVRNLIERQRAAEAKDACLLAERIGLSLDPWQQEAVRESHAQMILNCSRQSGKSTVTSVIALHTAIYQPGSLTLLLSPSLRQSQELFRKVKDGYQAIDSGVPAEEESALRMEFANDSRIVCLPGKEATIRGFSGVDLLIVDEASRVEDALYYAIRPMLAVSGGRIILLSTPFGKRGFFHKEWTEGEGWQRIQVTAWECPRISKDWLEEERRAIGSWWFEQEYECQFKETLDSVFSHADIQRALDSSVTPLF
ncbi:MAG TPA: terminase family protein [Methylocella sp.]|nr:terminase family protein [Methylocella sp.]